LKQKRQEAKKKKPIGKGIQVDTSAKPDSTTTGLKLKYDPRTKESRTIVLQQKKPTLTIPSSQVSSFRSRAGDLTIHKRSKAPPSTLHRKPGSNAGASKTTAKKQTSGVDEDCLYNDESIATYDTSELYTNEWNLPTEQVKEMSLTENKSLNNKSCKRVYTSKRKSFIPRYTTSHREDSTKPKNQIDEGKENADTSFDKPALEVSSSQRTHKAPARTKKHFGLLRDISSLKREHADALKMLEELDRYEEDKRKYVHSDSSYDSLFSNDETSREALNVENEDEHRYLDDTEDAYNDRYFNGDENQSCSTTASSRQLADDKEEEEAMVTSIIAHNETFSWLPPGLTDATHLSISLREIEDADEQCDNPQKNTEANASVDEDSPPVTSSSGEGYSIGSLY
jgi:hypothetical protein